MQWCRIRVEWEMSYEDPMFIEGGRVRAGRGGGSGLAGVGDDHRGSGQQATRGSLPALLTWEVS